MVLLFIILFSLFLVIAWYLKKRRKKDSSIDDPDIPVVTYQIDLNKELKRIYNEPITEDETADKYETIEEIERSERVSRLANDIYQVACVIESLLNDPSPYPSQVTTQINGIIPVHNRILKSKKNLYIEAVNAAKQELDDAQIKILEKYSSNPKAIDLTSLKMSLFDKYFFNFRDYWENQISQMKRTSAIINRRRYLLEKCKEWKHFLKNQNIKKYNTVLDDYLNFNISELHLLGDN